MKMMVFKCTCNVSACGACRVQASITIIQECEALSIKDHRIWILMLTC